MIIFASKFIRMLPEGFYTVIEKQNTEDRVQLQIALNPEHAIFKGHFPNNPVTPGVCMLQIFKETAERFVQKELMISECSNVKFMALINPEIHPNLKLDLHIMPNENEIYKVKASAQFEETTALKLSFVLKSV